MHNVLLVALTALSLYREPGAQCATCMPHLALRALNESKNVPFLAHSCMLLLVKLDLCHLWIIFAY